MTRKVTITGVGPVCGLGLGIGDVWQGLMDGRNALAPVKAFDASRMGSTIAAEVPDFKMRDFVPKSYRKQTKVMARDIEIAVAAAHFAGLDAGLTTHGYDADAKPSYDPTRVGCHIGAGLIAADLDELTLALNESRKDDGSFDIHHWGAEGMRNLTPLWLLKYLPNMLACHVTIIHDVQGPSNTITCAEASGGLSFGESLRVIQRGDADLCFCGGAESKVNPMTFYRQVLTGRLSKNNDHPADAVRPFDTQADGTAVGEGGGILTLEATDTYTQRGGDSAYAHVLGFGASQSVNRDTRSLEPTADGRGPRLAIEAALREANLTADQIDAVFPFGCGHPHYDAAEAAALRTVLGDRLAEVPVYSAKPLIGNCGAGAGAIDLALAAQALKAQTLPPTRNRDTPLDGLGATQAKKLDHALVFTTGFGGQNTAVVLGKV
ncbi:MAG: beta-ketoacyl-[acyl-carrier-protein] synthase family protein [Phycisphaerales bacterium JB063]